MGIARDRALTHHWRYINNRVIYVERGIARERALTHPSFSMILRTIFVVEMGIARDRALTHYIFSLVDTIFDT